MSADELAVQLQADLRAMTILLDSLAAMGLLEKRGDRYSVPADLRPLLTEGSPQSLLPWILHSMNLVRSWSRIPWVVKSGQPQPREASVRGAEGDRAAFVAAMHTFSGPIADAVVARLGPPQMTHLLDVGGASGTWTLAFLKAVPGARATLFDLPDAIEQARSRLADSPYSERVGLASGDFYRDELPPGADYAWVSAIIHQHAREDTRALFAKVYRALVPGGRIGIRDMVMDATRTRPVAGALFAINMLVNTATGGTFTFDEIAEDLAAAGFVNPRLSVPADDMNAVVEAEKPK